MSIPSFPVLETLEKRAADIVALVTKHDSESQATLSAKRRFFLVELDVAGLHPDHITSMQVNDVRALGFSHLAACLNGLHRLADYSFSDARQKWNPDAEPSRQNVPVSFDWFLASDIPQDWDVLDFLSRCESIFTGQGFTGEGKLFTRIFNHRVTLVAGYEDGIRLTLVRTEVGQYVAPVDLNPKPEVKVEPIDLVRRLNAYDGLEPADYRQKVQVPKGLPQWAFSFSELDSHHFKQLRDKLGQENFDKIIDKMGYKRPVTEFQTYTGHDGLPLHYYIRAGDKPGTQELILVSFGEYQPARYMAHIEGFWRIYGADLS